MEDNYVFIVDEESKTHKKRDFLETRVFKNIKIPYSCISIIRGKTGVGKTTLLNMLGLMDELEYNNGIMFYPNSKESGKNYKELKYSEVEQIRKKYFGFMFQHDHLIDGWSGWENIILPNMIQYPYENPNNTKSIVKEMIEEYGFFDLDNNTLKQSPSTYSGGQRQRVALLRAIIKKPKVLFVDEPFASVNSEVANNIINVLYKKSTHGTSVIMVIHDIHKQLLSNYKTNEINLDNNYYLEIKKD